jgi:uncharacterized protein
MLKNLETKSSRIEVIDVLRGFTLLGIVLVHLVEQYYAGMHPKKYESFAVKGVADQIAIGFTDIFIQGKFYMIFSFLFGLSFYLQLSKSDSGPRFFLRFAWRLIILFGIGFLHHLHYRGDILTIYAMLGLSLLVLYRLPDKYLLMLALVLVFNIPSVVAHAIQAAEPSQVPDIISHPNDAAALMYFETVKHGTYLGILKANLHEFQGKMDFQIFSGRVYITLGLFLLGLYAGRKGLFNDLVSYTPFFRKIIRYSLWSLLGCILFSVVFFGSFQLLGITLPQPIQWMAGGFAYDVFNAALASIYCSGVLLLFQKEKWKSRLMIFYGPGKMGLTTYLMQTAFGFFLFFSVGFGLLGDLGAAACFGIGILFFAFQILISKMWFRLFRYGPFEWIWRSLTDFKLQPLINAEAGDAKEPIL